MYPEQKCSAAAALLSILLTPAAHPQASLNLAAQAFYADPEIHLFNHQ